MRHIGAPIAVVTFWMMDSRYILKRTTMGALPIDPVCGMTVDRRDARHLAEYDGKVYAFCQISCRTRFIKDPAAYVGSSVSSGG